jgi:prepilin-type N-terminal cleavage/methylation domain-containing protein
LLGRPALQTAAVRHHGYTLIELLAVVVVLGLVAGVGVPPLVRMVGGSPLDRACQAVRDADRHARRLAHGRGIEFDLLSDGFDSRTASVEHSLRLAPGSSVSWLTADGKPLRRLAMNSRGRSVDMRVGVIVARDRREFQVSGISGEWFEIRRAEPPKVPVP